MYKTIEFKQSTPDSIPGANPWATPAKSSYKDLILRPEFAARRFQFPLGATWLRIVPAMKESEKESCLGVHALQYQGGRHCHPRTVSSDARSVFDRAYRWFLKNDKESLFSKENRSGHRFLTDPLTLLWFITELDGKPVTRLMLASGYDGKRGGVQGLGHQIWALSQEVDEDKIPLGDPADPDLGVQICVTKNQVQGAKYPSYHLTRGRIPAPIKDIFAAMDEEEHNALTPLESVVHVPTEEEEWRLLENIIDPETVRRIRESAD
jgi:hypothetical protein